MKEEWMTILKLLGFKHIDTNSTSDDRVIETFTIYNWIMKVDLDEEMFKDLDFMFEDAYDAEGPNFIASNLISHLDLKHIIRMILVHNAEEHEPNSSVI